MSKTVCIDLNGVLDTYTGWRGPSHWDPPREGAAAFLRALKERRYAVAVLTVRDAEETWTWLKRHGLDRDVNRVTNEKPPAVVYIDDRALCFRGDFEETLRELDAFSPHWAREAGEKGSAEEEEGEGEAKRGDAEDTD